MKASRSQTLALRHELLLARIALQRLELREGLDATFEAVSPSRFVGRFAAGLREHPTRLVWVLAAVVALRRIGLRHVARHALTAWRMWRTMTF